jgi:hypothetical protein
MTAAPASMQHWRDCTCGGGTHPVMDIHYPSCDVLKMAADLTRLPVNVYRLLREKGVPRSDLWMASVPEGSSVRMRTLGRPAWEPLLKAAGIWYLAPKHLVPEPFQRLAVNLFVTQRDEALLKLLDVDSTLEASTAGTPLQAMDFWQNVPTSLGRLSPEDKFRLEDTQRWVRYHYGSAFTSSELTF